MLIFITGGVRSGKSAYAEKYAAQLFLENGSTSITYIASGVPFDDEMTNRIKRHQQDRIQSPMNWRTMEVIDELPLDKLRFTKNDVVLWDCLTTWLTNVLYKTEKLGHDRIVQIQEYLKQLKFQIKQWQQSGIIVILVSNEVLDEKSSEFMEVNLYRKLLGELHQWIVQECDEAYEMDYSIMNRWK